MFRMVKVVALIMILFFLNGCLVSYGNYNLSTFTPLTTEKYKNFSGGIDLYFEGTSLNRSYLQIGFIEVIGKKDASNDMLIDYLKDEAYQKGADAVMNVKKMFKNRETGLLFDQENAEDYSAPVFTGIAIKYTERIPGNALQAVPHDTTFRTIVRKDHKEMAQHMLSEFAFSLMVWITVIVTVFARK